MKNRKNIYTCNECGKQFVTIEMCDGVTPASITCISCNGSAWSCFYPGNINKEPTFFWFKPSLDGLKKQTQWELNFFGILKEISFDEAVQLQSKHVESGGLLLAPSIKKYEEWSM